MSTATQASDFHRLGILDFGDTKTAHHLYTRLSELLTSQGDTEAILIPTEPVLDDGRALKLQIYDAICRCEAQGIDVVLLPNFACHSMMAELEAESPLHIIGMMDALIAHLSAHPEIRSLGLLTTRNSLSEEAFERAVATVERSVLYPSHASAKNHMTSPETDSARVRQAYEVTCQQLVDQGADAIVVDGPEAAELTPHLCETGLPLIDIDAIYAEYVVSQLSARPLAPFRVGVVGGVGPAATVDFLDKFVRNTPAQGDQDHIKVVLDQNPQIPDRTASLLGRGPDPTLALYAACHRLQNLGASILAIPCNTAHAFVDAIQPRLSIPIINMLRETVAYIDRHLPNVDKVGLLATTGTVSSGVYHAAAEQASFELMIPDQPHQEAVMRAIYGPRGVKAGFSTGECETDLMQAAEYLVSKGARALILGCTELPLIVPMNDGQVILGQAIPMLDPTTILARRCIELAGKAQKTKESAPSIASRS